MASSSGRGRRAGRGLECRGEPRFGRRAEIPHHPFGEGSRRLDVRDVVQHVECLERRIRPRFAHDAGLTAGRVERDHGGRGNGPLPERVEAAAIEIRAVVLDVFGVGQLVPEPGRLVRFHGRTAGSLDQEPGEPKRLVADHLGRQPQPRPARQQAVLGVAIEPCRA